MEKRSITGKNGKKKKRTRMRKTGCEELKRRVYTYPSSPNAKAGLKK